VSDLVSILSYFRRGKGDTALIVHHFATAGTWIYVLHVDFAHNFACIVCLIEFTTPLLALRWWMASSRLKTHPLYIVNGLLILLSWWALRIALYVGFLGWKVWLLLHRDFSRHESPLIVAWGVAAGLQILWCYKLTVGFIKVVKASRAKSKAP